MSSESISESIELDYWKLAIRKTILVFFCVVIAYFLAVISTILYYFFFSILTQTPQKYPGMMVWQPFWTLVIIFGFLIGLFKAILDIVKVENSEMTKKSNK